MHLGYLSVGVILLLASSFLDNTRGPMMPLLSEVFGLTYTQRGLFFVLGNFASVLGTFLLIPLSQYISERAISLSLFAACSLLVLSSWTIESTVGLWPFAIGLGAFISMAGAASNLCVLRATDVHDRSRAMSLIHLAYGTGSFFSPVIVSLLLSRGFSWQAIPCFVLLPCLFGIFILLHKISPLSHEEPIEKQKMLLNGRQIYIVITFAIYVAGEVVTSAWMSSYLVGAKGLTLEQAAKWLTGFFILMAITRAACFLRLKDRTEKIILLSSLFASAVFFALGHQGWLWGFVFAGVLGPFFPLFMARVSRDFPEQSKTLSLWVLTVIQATLGVFNFGVGASADAYGIAVVYWLPAGVLILSDLMLLRYFMTQKNPHG